MLRPSTDARDRLPADAFPRTRRPLPWILAAFIGMIFFVPIDQTSLKLHLPVDAKIDRLAVCGMLLAWIWVGGDRRTIFRSTRSKLYVTAAGLFSAFAVTSLLADSARVINLGEWSLAQKQLALLASLLAVGSFALTALRPEDLRGISTFLVGLGSMMAVGIIIERRTGYNVFYSISSAVLSPIAHVAPPATNVNLALSTDDRLTVIGPTSTGLAATAMLAMVLPFAIVRLLDAPTRQSWRLNALASLLIIAGAIATDKKSSLVLPLAVILFLTMHRPRAMLKLTPLAVVLLGFIHVSAPGALGKVLDPTQWFASNSTVHRKGDLTAIFPDILAHPILGRGWGSIDITQADQFRILDNELLGVLWQVGVVGLVAYVLMIITPIVAARAARRSTPRTLRPITVAASASCLAYLIVNELFDALSFSEVPYLFFVIAAFCTVASEVSTMPKFVPATTTADRSHSVVIA